ncbi:hypothetical protein BDK92_7083 [Micromonospora pisi]|uniref:Uncharacterized protein n=1 Tax=Micromonospora pisi TaxID=589240 RepID=A0A495JUY8_9ACTN|nr:hypothetical protein [Micromonospora pisi]RKR92641.1 hypothetical protein BDK92_7083 [Micromonospora pisi]
MSKRADELERGDGIRTGHGYFVVDSVESYGRSIETDSPSWLMGWVIGAKRATPGTEVLMVRTTKGYHYPFAADYEVSTYDPIQKAKDDATVSAAINARLRRDGFGFFASDGAR